MRRILAFGATLGIVCAALLVVGVLPASTYGRQRAEMASYKSRLRSVAAGPTELKDEISRLRSDAEVARLARLQFGMVRPGQEVYAIAGLRSGADTLQPVATTVPAPAPHRPSLAARVWGRLTFWS